VASRLGLLQGGRAIAAALVVLFHMNGTFEELIGRPFLGSTFAAGYSGVDFFFVLSGFVITYSARDAIGHPALFRAYLTRRLVRVYPIYWVLLAPILIALALRLVPYETGFSLSLREVLASLALCFGHVNFNGVSWSLSYEVYFYLLFGLTILSRRLLVVPVAILVLCAAGGIDTGGPALAGMTSPIVFEFFAGVLVAVVFTRTNHDVDRYARVGAFCLSLGGIVFVGACVVNPSGEFSSIRVVYFGFPSALIVLGAVFLETARGLTAPRWLSAVGDASYVLYLIHLPIVRVVNKLSVGILHREFYAMTVMNLALLLVLCWGSVIIHRRVERPMIRYLNTTLLPSRNRSPRAPR
jgi:exopolysaccharide production protein ExoZ